MNLLEKAAQQIEGQLKDGVDTLHVPETIEGQAWVRQAENLGSNVKAQIESLVHGTGNNLDLSRLQKLGDSLSSLQKAPQQTVDRIFSSLFSTAGKLRVPYSKVWERIFSSWQHLAIHSRNASACSENKPLGFLLIVVRFLEYSGLKSGLALSLPASVPAVDAGTSTTSTGSSHFGTDALLKSLTQMRQLTGSGTGVLQSQLDALRLRGAGAGQQAEQLLGQLQQQLQQSQQQLVQAVHIDANYSSILGPSLGRLREALTQGPSSLSSAFNEFTANFHMSLSSAGQCLHSPWQQKGDAQVACTLQINWYSLAIGIFKGSWRSITFFSVVVFKAFGILPNRNALPKLWCYR